MSNFTPVPAIAGGALIGASAALLLLTHGRVAGISGIFGGLLRPSVGDRSFRVAFLVGLLAAGACARAVVPAAFASTFVPGVPLALAAGLLVGFGTQLGGGCTSGHGVCGVSRLAARSIVATCTFMATGFGTVFLVRHLVGGGAP